MQRLLRQTKPEYPASAADFTDPAVRARILATPEWYSDAFLDEIIPSGYDTISGYLAPELSAEQESYLLWRRALRKHDIWQRLKRERKRRERGQNVDGIPWGVCQDLVAWDREVQRLGQRVILPLVGLLVQMAQASGRRGFSYFAKQADRDPSRWEDAYSEGMVVLIKALNTFNPALGFRLTTYVFPSPDHIQGRFTSAGYVAGRDIANGLTGLTYRERRQGVAGRVTGIEDFTRETPDGKERIFQIPDDSALPPWKGADQQLLREELPRIIRQASRDYPGDAEALILRCGLEGNPERTLREAGAVLGVCRERIRQREHRALQCLTLYAQAHGIDLAVLGDVG